MTREEQIKEQADIFAEKHAFRVPYDGSNDFYDKVDLKASVDGFVAGAKWADETTIKKACEWLEANMKNGVYPQTVEIFIKYFKKVMEG